MGTMPKQVISFLQEYTESDRAILNGNFRTHMAEWMEWRLTDHSVSDQETNKLSKEVNILTREEDRATEK